MTAITLNLLVEEQLAKEAEARDPFKVSLAIGIGLLVLSVIVGLVIGQSVARKQSEADALQKKWDSLQTKPGSSSGTDTKGLKAVAEDFRSINKSRQIFATQMALIKDFVPETVQLTQIGFTVVAQAPAAPPSAAAVEDPGKGDTGKTPRPSKPKTTEHLSLSIAGRATCARPEIEVDQFIKSLRAHPVFSTLVDDIRLRSISRTSGESDATNSVVPSVLFAIECAYKERK